MRDMGIHHEFNLLAAILALLINLPLLPAFFRRRK